ncbi:hypothetical protein H4R33_007246, partial [Dimargaris cristalligena]
ADEAWPELIEGEERLNNPEREAVAREVARKLHKYMQTYKYASASASGESQQDTVHYVMDEVGNAIGNSADPNCSCYSLLYCSPTTGAVNAYNILWPIKDLVQGEPVTRDYRLTQPALASTAADNE